MIKIKLAPLQLVNSEKLMIAAIIGTDCITFSPANRDTALKVFEFVSKLFDEMEKLKCTADIVFSRHSNGNNYVVETILRANGNCLRFSTTNSDLAEEMRDFLQAIFKLIDEGEPNET